MLVPFVLPTIVVATAFSRSSRTGSSGRCGRSCSPTSSSTSRSSCAWSARSGSGLDERLWDAAATLGAGPAQRHLRLTVPLLAPALASAASIVFLFCFTSFGVIVVLGGIRYSTLETEIYNEAARFFDLRAAAALALLQLAAVAAVVIVSGVLERRLGGARRPGRPAPRPTGSRRFAVYGIVVGSVALLLLPPIALVLRSLRVGDGYGIDHFASLFDETPALLVTPWHAVALLASLRHGGRR